MENAIYFDVVLRRNLKVWKSHLKPLRKLQRRVSMWAERPIILSALWIWQSTRKPTVQFVLECQNQHFFLWFFQWFFSVKSLLLLLCKSCLINTQLKFLTFRSQQLTPISLQFICLNGPILYYFPSPFSFPDSICRNADTLRGDQTASWGEVHCSGALHVRPRRMEWVELGKKHSDP